MKKQYSNCKSCGVILQIKSEDGLCLRCRVKKFDKSNDQKSKLDRWM